MLINQCALLQHNFTCLLMHARFGGGGRRLSNSSRGFCNVENQRSERKQTCFVCFHNLLVDHLRPGPASRLACSATEAGSRARGQSSTPSRAEPSRLGRPGKDSSSPHEVGAAAGIRGARLLRHRLSFPALARGEGREMNGVCAPV